MLDNTAICEAMTIKLGNDYPDYPQFNEGIRRAVSYTHLDVYKRQG